MSARKTGRGGNGYPAARPTLEEMIGVRKQVTRASTDFLKIDLETALTFCDIARKTDNQERQQRNRRAARKAYDTVLRFMRKTPVSAADSRKLESTIQRLKSELESLGEVF
jgi:hypothetical protein